MHIYYLFSLQEVKSGRVVPVLFEFDERFQAKYPDNYSFFDYNHPDKVEDKLFGLFDLVIADPPFLSDECQLKTAVFARKLLNPNTVRKLILCTGATMEEMVNIGINSK